MTPGPFHSQTEYVQVNGIIFYREHWTPRVISTGTTPKGYFLFGGSLSSPSGKSVDWCGAEANQEQLAIGCPASEMEIIFPQDTRHLALLVPHQLMQHYFGEELLAYALTSGIRHLKCNPQHGGHLFTRLDRMHSVYSELLVSDAESTTITKVTAHWGYTELGRFAVDYKQFFGESPSLTLKRLKASPEKKLSDVLGSK